MKATSPPTRRTRPWLTRNVFGLAFSSLFSDLGHEMITALLPGFLVTLGAPAFGLGLIEGISNFSQSVAELWSGRKADRVRDRAPWIGWGYVATTLKSAIALVPAWGWIIPIRTAAWLGRGIRGPMRDALIADDVPKEAWGKAYGFREALDTLGAFLGPLTAALLVGHLSYRLLIGLSVLPSVIAVGIILATIREVPHRLEHPSELSLAPVSTSPAFRRFIIAASLFAVGYIAPTFFILRAIQLLGSHGTSAATALSIGLYAIHTLFYAGFSYPAGALADRLPPRRLLATGYLLWAVVLVILAAGPKNLVVLAVPFVLSGTATAIIEPVQTTFAAQLLPPESRGQGLGLLSGLTGLGQLVSGLAVGAVWTAFSAPSAFILSTILAILGLVLLRFIPVKRSAAGNPS